MELVPLVELRLILDFKNDGFAAKMPRRRPHKFIPRRLDAEVVPTRVLCAPFHIQWKRLAAVFLVHQPLRPAIEHDMLRHPITRCEFEVRIMPVKWRVLFRLEKLPFRFWKPTCPTEADALIFLQHCLTPGKRSAEPLAEIRLRGGLRIRQRGDGQVAAIETRVVIRLGREAQNPRRRAHENAAIGRELHRHDLAHRFARWEFKAFREERRHFAVFVRRGDEPSVVVVEVQPEHHVLRLVRRIRDVRRDFHLRVSVENISRLAIAREI